MGRIASEEMLKESLVYRGDTYKVKKVFEKADRGEDITVAFIGGSITQGCNATIHENCYANRTYLWFKNRFPKIKVTYLNAGIGATGSIIGVHRVENQVLSKNPDIVFVDFAVNDKDNKYNKIAYDSLIRRILTHNSKPAVVEVFMSTDILGNVQEQQIEIGKRYNVPMVSFRDAIRTEISNGNLKWNEVASDEVHPNDRGHKIISELLINLLESIDRDDDIKGNEDKIIGQPVFGEDYIKGQILNSDSVEVICTKGMVVDTEGFQGFKNGWTIDSDFSSEGNLKLEVEGKNVFVLYKKLIKDTAGSFDVKVNGNYIKNINSYFEGGWGDYSETEVLIEGDKKERYTIEFLVDSNNIYKEIYIMGLLVS